MQFLFLLVSLLPFFEIQDTIYSYATSGNIYSGFQLPFNYTVKSFNFGYNPAFSSLLMLQGYNIYSPSLGGTSPEENLVLFEGIPLVNPMLGYQELSVIPENLTGAVEILHSSSPYTGLAGIGGTLNFISSKKPLEIKISNLKKGLICTIIPWKTFPVTAFYESFVDSFPTKCENLNLWVKNTHDEKFGLFSKFKTGDVLLIKRKAGAPGPLGSLSMGERYEFLAGINFDLPLKKFNLELSSTYTSQTYTTSSISDVHKTIFLRSVIKWKKIEAGVHIYGASSTKIGRHIIPEIFGKVPVKRKLTQKNELLTTINLNYNYTFRKLSSDLSISLSHMACSHLYSFLTISLNHRNPTLNELYWPEDNFARGNPGLRPERSLNVDAGLREVAPAYYVNLHGFFKKIENGILWIQEDKYFPRNFALLVHRGIGAEVAFKPWKDLVYVEFDINFQESKSNGMPFIYRPTFTSNSSIRIGPTTIELSYIGKRPERPSSTKMLPPVYLINLSFCKNIAAGGEEFSVKSGIKNLLNINYEIIRGYPNPGRELFLEISVKGRT